jgi:type IV secretion system protein VirD4
MIPKLKSWFATVPLPMLMALTIMVICGPVVRQAVLASASGAPARLQLLYGSAASFAALTTGVLAALALSAALHLHERLPVAIAGLAAFLTMALWLIGEEVLRLAPYIANTGGSVLRLATYADPGVITGSAAGVLASVAGLRLASGSLGGVKRARRAALGDADWMTMQDAAKLFPADGQIIIGERTALMRPA